MSNFEVIVLALIQGISEFLPISSSAHLILPSYIFGFDDQGIIFDTIVHLATLLAIIFYLKRDITKIALGTIKSLKIKQLNHESSLCISLFIASIPALLIGFFLKEIIEMYLRNLEIIVLSTFVFAILLYFADKYARQRLVLNELSLLHAFYLGLAQAIALIPGTSRSGITITAGLSLGYKRVDCALISFLMSIPIILAASGYYILKLILNYKSLELNISIEQIFLAFIITFVSAYYCVKFFMHIISNMTMLPFIVYRLILALVLTFYII